MISRLVLLGLYAIAGLLASVISVSAQGNIPQATIDEVAKDLANLNQAVLRAQQSSSVSIPVMTFGQIRVTDDNAPIKAGAGRFTTTIDHARAGTVYPILDKAEGWYAVRTGEKSFGWIKASDVVPVTSTSQSWTPAVDKGFGRPQPAPTPSGSVDMLYATIVAEVARLREKYRNNPHVFVKGFDVSITVPPALNIGFEFK
jgi:hypothetical protein